MFSAFRGENYIFYLNKNSANLRGQFLLRMLLRAVGLGLNLKTAVATVKVNSGRASYGGKIRIFLPENVLFSEVGKEGHS